jgi:3-oxoacyl-[acyl-carrier-protein] synthase II
MRLALASAGLSPAEVTYVNAHGTSTKLGDVAEAAAIRSVFGDAAPAVSSIKAVTGHMLGASGAAEAVASVLALQHGALPPTHNLDDPDPACDLDLVRCTRRGPVQAILSNSFAFGGHNVSLAFGTASTPRQPAAPIFPSVTS